MYSKRVRSFDDIDHSVKANTSLHLTEEKTGDRSFITGDISQLIKGKIEVNSNKPRIYAPFGMGIIDLLVGKEIYQDSLLKENSDVLTINNFFPKPYVQ